MRAPLRIAYLADHPEVLPVLKGWFETEWAAYYGPNGPGDAEGDLLTFSSRDGLPVGVVAFLEGEVCGVAALKAESITTHPHLYPWAAAGLVSPPYRGQGIGARLLVALEDVARNLGYARIYCGTSTSVRLLHRSGWQFIERVAYSGEEVSLFEKPL